MQAKYVQAFKNGKLHTNLACNVKGNWSCIINFAEKNGDVIVNGFKAKKSIFEERGLKSKDVIKKIVFSDSSGKESEVSWKDLLTIRAPGTLIFTVERGSGKKAQTLTISASIIWNSDELMYIR